MRAGTRGIAVLAAIAGFAVLPQLAHGGPARADGADRPVRHHDPRGEHRDRDAVHHPGVALNASAPQGRIVPGRTYRWPYTVTNNGVAPVRNVTLATAPDHDLKVLMTPPKCAWRHSAVLVCRVGLIPRGQARHGSIVAKVNPRARVGKSLASPARLSWQNVPAADQRSATPAVVGTRTAAFPPVAVSPTTDLAVRSAAPGRIGSSDAPYEVSVTNDGPVTAESVVVRGSVAAQRGSGPCADARRPGSCARLSGVACDSGCALRRPEASRCDSGCAPQWPRRPDFPTCDSGCAPRWPGSLPRRPDFPGCDTGSCANPSCTCSRTGAGRVPVPADRRASGVPERELPIAGPAGADRGKAAPITFRRDHRCVTQGTGFVCPLGAIPPGRTRTLRLAVRGHRGAHERPFRCLSTVRSGTPDSNMANNRSACHTRRAHPLPARAAGAPVRHAAAPTGPGHLPVTGGSFDAMALWGLGLAGAGLALFGVARLRRGEQG